MRHLSFVFVMPTFLAACGGAVTPADGGGVDTGTTSDAATPDLGAGRCVMASDCTDIIFCNGAESCRPTFSGADARGCVAAATGPCLAGQICDEAMRRCTTISCTTPDVDGDGHDAIDCPGGDDCDDADPNRYPGNREVCDVLMHDEDCDPATYGVRDLDGDGDPDATCCNVDTLGASRCGSDCDDTRAGVHRGATEACNAIDDDCNGMVDDGAMITFYADCDGDGHGSTDTTSATTCTPPRATTATGCAMPSGYAPTHDDCNDNNSNLFPGRTEDCNGVDDNCNGTVDEGAMRLTYYRDHDGDGYVTAASMITCTPDPDFIIPTAAHDPVAHPTKIDCDDSDAMVHPDAVQGCGIDNDCDPGTAPTTPTWYVDCDGDGFAATATNSATQCAAPTTPPTAFCTAPAGTYMATITPLWESANALDAAHTDCDDFHRSVHPGNPDVCDGYDTDCVGGLNGSGEDNDGDGYANPSCMGPPAVRDCDDTNPAVHPTAVEIDGDGADENCDGMENCYLDADGDLARAMTVTTATTDVSCSLAGHQLASAPVDCCDMDPNAHLGIPGTSWFAAANACGNFDYDCSGTAEEQFPSSNAGLDCSVGVCDPTDGWAAGVPACGAASTWSGGCRPRIICPPACGASGLLCPDECGGTTCLAPLTSTRTQACH